MENFISCPEGNNSITFVLSEREVEYVKSCIIAGLAHSSENRIAQMFQECLHKALVEFNRLREQRLSVPPPVDVNISHPLDDTYPDEGDDYYDDDEEDEDY